MTELSGLQLQFIKLDKKYQAEIKPFMEVYKAAKEALANEIGVGGHFQDDEGTVYLTVVPEGRFVHFDRFGVQRTRRIALGETKGDLSMTAARELGYQVEGK